MSRATCLDRFRRASAHGLRSLAVAARGVSNAAGFTAADERELTLVGLLTFTDPLIDGAGDSIEPLARTAYKSRF